MKFTITALFTIGVAVVAPHSVAEQTSGATASSAAVDEAGKRFQNGVSLYRDGSFDAALAEFSRAYELQPDYRVLYNIGQVQAERSDYVAAVTVFRRYLEEGASDIPRQRRSDVESEIARLEGRVATLQIEANVPGAEIWVDGMSQGKLPREKVLVNAGIRRIAIKKVGFKPAEETLTLTGGETRKLKVSLEAETASEAAAPPPRSSSASTVAAIDALPSSEPEATSTNVGFWVSLAVTGIATGGTVAFAVLTKKANDDYDKELQTFPGSASRLSDARDTLKRDALITDICGGVAVLGLGTTIFFAAVGGSKRTHTAKSGDLSLHTGPSGLGWQVYGKF